MNGRGPVGSALLLWPPSFCRGVLGGIACYPSKRPDRCVLLRLPCPGFSRFAGRPLESCEPISGALLPRNSIPLDDALLRLAAVTTVLIYGQMKLGATMRHEHKDLAILDFPTANRSWWPDTSAAAMAQNNQWRDARGAVGCNSIPNLASDGAPFRRALLVAIFVLLTVRRLSGISAQSSVLRTLSILWIALLLTQVTLSGAWTIWSNKAADIATTHVAVGATMLSLGVCLAALGFRFSRSPGTKNCPARFRRTTGRYLHESRNAKRNGIDRRRTGRFDPIAIEDRCGLCRIGQGATDSPHVQG